MANMFVVDLWIGDELIDSHTVKYESECINIGERHVMKHSDDDSDEDCQPSFSWYPL